MASPERVVPSLPETLPEDFGGWDSEDSAADSSAFSWEREASPSAATAFSWEIQTSSTAQDTNSHTNSNEWEAWEAAQSSSKTAEPLGQSSKRGPILSPVEDEADVSDSGSPGRISAEQQRDFAGRDHESPPSTQRAYLNEWEAWEAAHTSGKTAKPFGQPSKRLAVLSPVVDKPQVLGSGSSARVSVERQAHHIDRESHKASTGTPAESDEWAVWAAAHSIDKTPKPAGQSAERKWALSAVVERPHASDSAASAEGVVEPLAWTSELAEGSPSGAARRLEAGVTPPGVAVAENGPNLELADQALFQMFSSVNFEVEEEPKGIGKKWIAIAAVGAGSILLLLLMIPLFHHGAKSAAIESVQPLTAATDAQANPNKAKPRASEPLAQGKAGATAATQDATDDQTANGDDANTAQTPTQTQTQMMNDQLAAPTRIPQGIKAQVAENEPAATSIGPAGADGLGGSSANASIFNSHSQAVVKAAPVKPLAISSGVAVGMLIQKTAPIYPPIAKQARVSGTVEIEATISKMGTIKDLRAVNGPAMLRQAAVDAVRTWRYQPYKLNNEPTEVETTINVVFSLGG